MHVLEQIQEFIVKKELFNKQDRLLIACSGGKDSMFLVYFLLQEQYNIGIAHIDHKTRSGASTQDAEFVEAFCAAMDIPFHLKTLSEIDKQHLRSNFQAEARALRYEFLERTRKEYAYDYILTAHHQNDQVESFFINLARSSGLAGLTGISEKRNYIVRPLLQIDRATLDQFVDNQQLEYREDESNASNEYQRNALRNEIIPRLRSWNKDFEQGVAASIDYLKEANSFLQNTIDSCRNEFCREEKGQFKIKTTDLSKNEHRTFLMYELVKTYGFNRKQSDEMLDANQSGTGWISNNYEAVLHQSEIIIQARIEQNLTNSSLPFSWADGRTISLEKPSDSRCIKTIYLPLSIDIHKLRIRHWEAGDFMQTTGGRKKLKKIFNEQKISRLDKPKYYLLAHEQEVFAIIDLIDYKLANQVSGKAVHLSIK